MNDKNVDMKYVFEYLIKDIPTWKVVLIDKWTDFKVWFYAKFLIK